eukprot:CAMPEP_0183297024 /NCGR_PEP_ID=MMETSP0160_2-20130417/4409_1 /TAXON_ID=2839 ORGANISM="Odontella Sinensis, Strain Grunow 1884" /NCGR_SAMPLE_ID=MMETSP0160_2 /ASSEMBLY_ACC=CAM_ASM_000250 /LENGTH=42 /DNA_ID= /DNA_START= /DNA_END= /DNA_ORIENTATION=
MPPNEDDPAAETIKTSMDTAATHRFVGKNGEKRMCMAWGFWG